MAGHTTHTDVRGLGMRSGLECTVLGQGSASLGDMYERISDVQALGSVRTSLF